MGSYPYDKMGTGELLPRAREAFESTLKKHGWYCDLVGKLTDATVDAPPLSFNVPIHARRYLQAVLYHFGNQEKDRTYIAPLVAKGYMIKMQGKDWWSVSEKVIGAAESGVVCTYVEQEKQILVTSSLNAAPDLGYLRYWQRYHGWFKVDSASLEDWLKDAGALKGQTRFAP